MKAHKKYVCRGFQCISAKRRREISVLGAKALHEQGKANKFTSKTGYAASLKALEAKKKN